MKTVLLALILIFSINLYCSDVITVELPKADTLVLTPYSTFDFADINESSALVKSHLWEDVYWTLNDSGSKNRIFPINREGVLYRPGWYEEDEGGVYIGDAVNIDWESMTSDTDGNLYIGACGNNANLRQDLCIYIFKDPHPQHTSLTRYYQKINFYYPEQTSFPPPQYDYNYDAEAIFWAEGRLFLLTKHRSDTHTRLYTFNSMYPDRQNPVTLLSEFDIKGYVTGAECNPEGNKLAVLTYSAVWVFTGETGDWFKGEIHWLPISAKQCESICWDDEETLLITNEQMELFEVKTMMMMEVK